MIQKEEAVIWLLFYIWQSDSNSALVLALDANIFDENDTDSDVDTASSWRVVGLLLAFLCSVGVLLARLRRILTSPFEVQIRNYQEIVLMTATNYERLIKFSSQRLIKFVMRIVCS